MNTPAHLIIAASLYAKPDHTRVTIAALLGALVPDLSLYVMAGVALFIMDIPGQVVFGELYFSDTWQMVFAIDNSMLLWGAGFVAALWLRAPIVTAFAGSGLVHVLCDFPLHHDDGRAHFWPISDWVFQSPVSYWDPNHWGHIVAPAEIMLTVGLLALLYRRFYGLVARSVIVVAGMAQIAPAVLYWFAFA